MEDALSDDVLQVIVHLFPAHIQSLPQSWTSLRRKGIKNIWVYLRNLSCNYFFVFSGSFMARPMLIGRRI